MPRQQPHKQQLDLEWVDAMRWADVPADVQERLRELLADFLRQVASRGGEEGAAGE
jgi:hypothetical protein